MNLPPEFPAPIRALPKAKLPIPGAEAFLAQSAGHQILFMAFAQDVEIPEHAHAAQWGVVLAGNIELTIDGRVNIYGTGQQYFIPAGARHSAKIRAGYQDVTFFDSPDRYQPH